ncbi:MAG: hypothetical protein H0X42_09380 [Solirubrobacterales bacterium]|nr:hypothetical protein [Solirubrobacterales bacterium]
MAGDCALRQAVDKGNLTPGPDTVILPAGQYFLKIPGSGEDEVGDLNVVEGKLAVQGAGARKSIIDAGKIESRIFEVKPGTGLSLSGSTVTGGNTEDDGGGIFVEEAPLNLDGVSVSANESFNSGEGGGIFSEEAEVTIRASSISGNRNSGDGGGIAAYGKEHGVLSIENSTLADNVVDTSLYPGKPGWGAYGGAMEGSVGQTTLRNVTIEGNSIRDGNGGEEGSGAAISAEPKPGVVFNVVNTIIFGNTATLTEEFGECIAPLTSEGHNLEGPEPAGEPRCFEAASDLIANPLLGALANNGGEADTLALTAGSPAIDTGDASRCPATDQCGVPRPQFSGCDIGAFELAPAPVVPPPVSVATLKFKKVKRNLKKGTVTILAQVSGPGQLTVTGKKVVKVKRNATGAQVVKLVVRARGKAKKTLSEMGKVKVRLKAVFVPSGGGAAVSKTKSVVLKRKLH